jgi:hypothetical protein
VKFFFDNHLAPKLARGLNQMVEPKHRVLHLKDRFPGNTEDVVWMQALARETDLVIVTADIRIGRNPHEVLAWKQAGHTIFFLKPGIWQDGNRNFTEILDEQSLFDCADAVTLDELQKKGKLDQNLNELRQQLALDSPHLILRAR